MAYPYDGMFYPTLPQDTQDFGQVLAGVGRNLRDFGRGVSYLPMDLAGAAADIGNLPLQGIDYLVNQIRGTDQNYLSTERPFGGSAQLIDVATKLGLSQQPTGSAPETIGRVMAGLINPMAGARAVGRVGEITTEQANRAADALVRQITGNPTATAPQVLEATSMPFMQAVAPKAPILEKIYHGTSPQAAKQIEKAGFDITKSADGSVWFTNNPDIGEVSATGKGAVVERLADINKLKLGGWEETDKFSTNELIQKGFDGLRLVDGDTVTYQIFNPKKLESPISDKAFTGLLEPQAGAKTSSKKWTEEEIAVFNEQKLQKQLMQAKEQDRLSQENKQLAKKFIEKLPSMGVAKDFTKDQLDSISYYRLAGDRKGAMEEGASQTVNLLEKKLKDMGVQIVHKSNIDGGNSIYANVNGKIVRISDHYLPETSERLYKGNKWDNEVITYDWANTNLDDYLKRITSPVVE